MNHKRPHLPSPAMLVALMALMLALGGGGTSSDGFIYDTSPNVGSGTPTGWVASAEQADGSDAQVQAWVVCGAP